MSQSTAILKYLQTGRSFTPLMALDRWGVFRLAARVRDLRAAGHRIETHIVKRGKTRYAAYLLDRA